METSPWDDHEVLFRDLADAIPGPPDLARIVAEQGYAIYGWRTVDSDLRLAELSFDSRLALTGTARAEVHDTRVLVFRAQPLSIELQVVGSRVAGQVVPWTSGEVLLEPADQPPSAVEVDQLGFFVLPPPSPGRFRLRCETPTGRLVTDWVQL